MTVKTGGLKFSPVWAQNPTLQTMNYDAAI